MSNAVKFTQDGGVTLRALTCESGRPLESKIKLCFVIADTGAMTKELMLDGIKSCQEITEVLVSD